MRRYLLLLLLALALALVLIAGAWFKSELITPYYSGPAEESYVEIPRGSTTDRIAGLLSDAGILRFRLPFILYVRWRGLGRHLQAGEYRFAAAATPIRIAERLVQGDTFYYSVTIPEGLTARETIDVIAHAGLGRREEMERALRRTEWIHDIAPQAADLEGYLFPDTYRFARKTTSEQIIRTLVDQFRIRLAQLTAEHALQPGRTVSGIVTMASLVEKEVCNGDERLKVASVLENRLDKGMPLACDPTVIYALKLAGKYDGNIRRADLRMESPYNTYVHTGMPPGPIANPGLDSLRAAIAPAKTEYLFFVSRNDGTHQFSKDFRTHQIAVDRYQKRAKR